MKITMIFAAGLLLSLAACTKKSCQDHVLLHPATVVRDCTGTYLRTEDGKDYNVCNLEAVEPYPAGTRVEADFKRISACPAAAERIVCYMLHANEGWIEVTSVR